MNPVFIQLILQYGIPAAYKIWTIFKDGRNPTEADWQELLTLNKKTGQDYIDEAQAAKDSDAKKNS